MYSSLATGISHSLSHGGGRRILPSPLAVAVELNWATSDPRSRAAWRREKMAEGALNSGSGMEEGLIPGLPDDVSMQCLARISHGYEGVMQCVSKSWRDAFRGEEIGKIRAREGLSGDWIFVYTNDQFDGWQAYDPAADRWHPLPPAPGFGPSTRHVGFCCVVVCRRLLVLGGRRVRVPDEHFADFRDPTDYVLCFDPFFRKWTELPGMITPRAHFLCDVIDGRVVVTGGGSDSAESFDPETNTWEALPELSLPLEFNLRRVMHNGRYQVLSGGCAIGMSAFVLSVNGWNVMRNGLEMLTFVRDVETTERRLYWILYKWLAVFSDHIREWWRLFSNVSGRYRWPDSSFYGLVKFRGRLYLVGGIMHEYDVGIHAKVPVELSTVRYCNLSPGTPIDWHHVRPLLGRGGRVRACATIQQE